MDDMNNILDKIEKIKKDLKDLEDKLETLTVYGKEKHGLVKTVVNGKGKIVDFEFTNGVVDKEFKEAIISSINDGLNKAKNLEKKEKENIIGDIDLPDVPGIL